MEKEKEEIIQRRKIDGDVDRPTNRVDIVQYAFSNVNLDNRMQRFVIDLQSFNCGHRRTWWRPLFIVTKR